ncbi:MAG: PhzF family phenazine biosynthesis protein [Rhodobacteraceae bacterium]|nr:PhzF family phenazine biosynthesis protein [Paracoccaceae bacterium]
MSIHAVDWVDAFTSQPMGGNGCAVVHDAAALDAATCIRFVRETSLVECTFLEPSDVADVKVRYFLASHEIPFAGHPTVATAASLYHRGILTGPMMTFETGAGIIPVELTEGEGGPVFTMTQAKPEFGPTASPEEVADVMGLGAADIVGTPQLVSTGLGFFITVVKSMAAMKAAKLDVDALRAFGAKHGVPDGTMLEPYLVTLEGAKAGDTFARLLMAPPSPPEDPFTGSATGAAAAYLWHHGHLEGPRYVAEQGHLMERPGQADVEVLGPREAPEGVRVCGQTHVLMSGDLRL